MIQAVITKEILRKTDSVCPVCMDTIPAFIVEKQGSIYIEKKCQLHGVFEILVSSHPDDYKTLSETYFYFMPPSLQQKEYYLCATTRCNTGCPICFLKQCHNNIGDLSLDEIRRIGANKNIKRFTFSHGEPTLCDNLPGMIKILRGYHKIVNIHTNGIRIANSQYAYSLKAAGISHISIQFDGFSDKTYSDLRGRHLLNYKLRALHNLKKLSIPVTLNVTIAKGVNEFEIGKIFDYAIKEVFIKDVSFITYCHYGSAQNNMDKYIMPDELLAYIEEHSAKKILRKDIVLFQKLFYAYTSVFKKRKCFNYYHYLVVRTKRGYSPINEFINLKKAARLLDLIRDQDKILTRFVFFRILLSSLKLKSLSLFCDGFFIFLRGGYPRKPSKFLAITFATICDPYKYDSSIANNCGQGIITSSNVYDSYGTYLMQDICKER